MTKKPEKEKKETTTTLRLLGYGIASLAMLFFAIGALFVAAGVWEIVHFADCRRTVVCDEDVLPPSMFVITGGIAVIVAGMLVGVCRLILTEGNTDVANPTPRVGTWLLGTGPAFLALGVQQRIAGADLQYYQWIAQHGVWSFATDLTCSILAIVAGLWLMRRPRKRPTRAQEGEGE